MAKAKQQDTTAEAIFKKLDAVKEATKGSSYHSGDVMKRTFISFILDAAGIEDKELRTEVGKMAMATPGWLGCGNNSACRQARENKKIKVEATDSYGF